MESRLPNYFSKSELESQLSLERAIYQEPGTKGKCEQMQWRRRLSKLEDPEKPWLVQFTESCASWNELARYICTTVLHRFHLQEFSNVDQLVKELDNMDRV